MNEFDVWLRRRAALKPHIYGPQLASEGREMGQGGVDGGAGVEPPKEPVLERQEVVHVTVEELKKPYDFKPPEVVAMDWKSRAAGDDSDDAEVVEDIQEEEEIE